MKDWLHQATIFTTNKNNYTSLVAILKNQLSERTLLNDTAALIMEFRLNIIVKLNN